jgi:predicted MFS family arabinose efflux permease
MSSSAVADTTNPQPIEMQSGVTIPPRLWPVKVLYFLLFAAQGVYFTFINVYYASIGLSST